MSIAGIAHRALGRPERLRVAAFDGSEAGPATAPSTLRIASPQAVAYLVRAPGELGFARAYITGAIDVEGDLYDALLSLGTREGQRGLVSARNRSVLRRFLTDSELRSRFSFADIGALAPLAVRAVTTPAPTPDGETRLGGRLHSRHRDATAIASHYDESTRFFELLLGPTMAYSCAVYPGPDATLDEAQTNKFDLVCKKLGLEPGMRVLETGCGWGTFTLHAAREYDVNVTGVTLSRAQAEYGRKAIADAGLAHRATILHCDYRDAAGSDYDAIASIGMTEHVGARDLGNYFTTLLAKLRPGGRLLNHAMAKTTTRENPAFSRRGFMNRYVFPDAALHAVGTVVSEMQDAGFEVRHEENLREHYAKTLAAWAENLEANWDAAVGEIGAPSARIFRLYIDGSRIPFEQQRVEIHQVLGVRPDGSGAAAMPLRPNWE